MSTLEILSELDVRRLPDGERQLLKPLLLILNGVEICIPEGFITDYSSWPRWLPGPSYEKIDIAGIVHDYLFKHNRLGLYGEGEVGYVQSNRYWFEIAMAGEESTRCNPIWAWAGRCGLFVGSWPVWMKYRAEDTA